MKATVGLLFLAALFYAADGARISISRGKNVTKIDDFCVRMHNNTALEGSSPILMMQATAFECQKKCVDIYPECSAVVYYYLHNETKKHYCYLFEQNSINDKVELVEQKPENKKDIVRMLEIVLDCHQFDAHPPLEEDGLASSTDKVDRKKRQQGHEAVQGVGDWTDWTACTAGGHETRSQACEYGRKIQRRGCPARSAPQRIPAPPAQQFPPRQPNYPTPEQRQQHEQQLREQQLREQQHRQQQEQQRQQQEQQRQQQQQQRQQQGVQHPIQPQSPQVPPPQVSQGPRAPEGPQVQPGPQTPQRLQVHQGQADYQIQVQRQQEEQRRQQQQRQQELHQQQTGHSQIHLQSGPAPHAGSVPQPGPAPQSGPIPPVSPQQPQQQYPLERSPLDQQAQLYQQRMSQYRENYNQRHPARPHADPCPGGYCAPTVAPVPTQAPVLAPVIQTPTLPPFSSPNPTRYRPAPPPPPACDGQGCVAPQVVNGQWHDWSEWSSCSCTCGDGAKSRRRECSTNNCQGPDYETEPCNLGPCQTWSEWCEWSTCSSSCGSGERSRTRFCHLGTNRCEGKDYEAEQCSSGPCPEWAEWEDWGQCSVTCGNGVASRQRTCLGGTFGDHLCQGPKTEQRVCEAGPCSQWSPWEEWSNCSASCGNGMKTRQRVCQYGTDCQGPNEESLFCYGPPCASWTEWCEWSGCSSKCGPGQRTRTRGCLDAEGKEATTCQGLSIETTICEGNTCCNWSEWCHWSMCDKECGGGQSIRTRTCLNSAGSPDSACHCDGNDREEKECNTESCSPQCAWNQWCDWSPCSTQLACEVGVQSRSRQCVGESGCHCIGLAEETQQCRGTNPCPPKPPC